MTALPELLGRLLGVEWTRPLALFGVVLALFVLLAGVVRERPLERPIGTTRLWREVLEERARAAPKASARKRRRFPLHLWMLAMAIVLTVIAMAGPTPVQPPVERRFTVYIDDSPSMQLAWNKSERSRGDVASEAFERWRETLEDSGVAFEWREGLPRIGGKPGDIVVTDDAEPWLESPVGLFACGGIRVPGAIGQGVDEEARPVAYVMTSEGEIETELLPKPFEVSWNGELPSAIRSVFEAWAEERGFSCIELASAGPGTLLALRGCARDAEVNANAAEGGHEGWLARGPYAALPPRSASAVDWVASETGSSLVRYDAGLIEIAWPSWDSREGSDTDFALSWARLFDRVVRSPQGVVAAAERKSAGKQTARAPQIEEARAMTPGEGRSRFPLDFFFAAAAFLLAGVAGLVRART